MKNARIFTALLTILLICSFPAFGASLEPLTVSPGATDRFTGVEARCPTFSWQAVPGAVAYEVVVYELPPEVELAGWSLDEAVEVLFVELPVGVAAWTPSLEDGLARGADHVWFVRGVYAGGGEDATEWSVARFFRVAGGMSELGIGLQSREVGESSGAGGGAGEARSRGTKAEGSRNAMAERVGETKTKDVSTAMAAIRGEMPDATGETYGVVGISNSLEGGGLGAVNTAGGPDLVLDGVEDGQTDLDVFQWGVDRASGSAETFAIGNTGGGGMTLNVDGAEVVTTLTDQDTLMDVAPSCELWQVPKWDGSEWICFWDTDTLLGLSCAAGEVAKWGGSNWNCDLDIDTDTTYSASSPISLVGTTLGLDSTGCDPGTVMKWSGDAWICAKLTGTSIVDEAIGLAQIEGSEVRLYLVNQDCDDAGELGLIPICLARECSPGWFFNCGGGCNVPYPMTCFNDLVGYLLSPEINEETREH